jgi:hypothetical protein
VLEVDAPRRLVHTHRSDVSGLPDSPEHYQRVAWDLRPTDDGGTELTITERNLPSEDAAKTSEQGWQAAFGGSQRPVGALGGHGNGAGPSDPSDELPPGMIPSPRGPAPGHSVPARPCGAHCIAMPTGRSRCPPRVLGRSATLVCRQ